MLVISKRDLLDTGRICFPHLAVTPVLHRLFSVWSPLGDLPAIRKHYGMCRYLWRCLAQTLCCDRTVVERLVEQLLSEYNIIQMVYDRIRRYTLCGFNLAIG
jgi:hypothetical protein